jgi:hypothetical protein
MPRERNRLALIRWAVERADLEECGERLLGLRAEGYANVNLLRKSPLVLVRGSALGTVLEALGLQRERASWEVFAEETGRGCGSCVFGSVESVEGVVDYCPRCDGGTVETCEGFIGADDPVVIPVGYGLRKWFEELGVEMEEVDGERYVTSVEKYVEWCRQAEELAAERMEMEASRKATAHLVEIREFMDWQEERTEEELGHFQAHACRKCAMYCVDQDPPCLFAVEPLKRWRDEVRAPEFKVLVTEDGRMLPRCEQFCYQEVPASAGDSAVAGLRGGGGEGERLGGSGALGETGVGGVGWGRGGGDAVGRGAE